MAKQNNTSLSKEMIDNIQNYENKIRSITDPVEAVRQTIGYQIGSAGTQGHVTTIREIIQNAFDEAIRPYSPCNYIKVTFDERDLSATIIDNGRGVPFNKMIEVYTNSYSSSNYDKSKSDYSAGVNGVGAFLTFALSSTFRAESYILGEARYIEGNEGKLLYNEPKPMKNIINHQGTIVSFKPSFKALGNIETTCEDVYSVFFGIFPLLPIGTTVEFVGIGKDGAIKFNESRTNQDGILTGLIESTSSPLIAPIVFGDDNGTCKIEIAFTYDTSDLSSEVVMSYSNYCITLGGTHKDGFLDGLSNYFRNYMNKIYLGEKSKITVVNNDIKTGLRAVVNASHIAPIFNAQAKEILRNEDMYSFVKNITIKTLDEWIKTNPGPLQKMCKFFKDVAETRVKSDEAKVKISTKYQTSLMTGKPKKYLPASGNSNLELLIVEGDSALGSCKGPRDSDKQALFPIRGKIINAFTTERSKFLSNEEVASIITIVGGGYGKSFDISKVPFEKIIIFADADPDGAHISDLLLKFFLLYMTDIIKEGRLYRAVPPLYGVKLKGGMKYFTNKIEFTHYNQSIFTKNNIISTVTDQKLSSNELTSLFITNIDYVYTLEIASNMYAIDPELLEFILINYNLILSDINKFKKILKQKYRFLDLKTVNGVSIIEGLVGVRYHTIFLNERLINSCKEVINILNANKYVYHKLNGQIVSLYSLMKTFENSMPNNLTRYKGLGEQDPDELGESALRPDSQRTLIRYTIDDIKSEIERIRFLESNKNELFKNLVITRQDIE